MGLAENCSRAHGGGSSDLVTAWMKSGKALPKRLRSCRSPPFIINLSMIIRLNGNHILHVYRYIQCVSTLHQSAGKCVDPLCLHGRQGVHSNVSIPRRLCSACPYQRECNGSSWRIKAKRFNDNETSPLTCSAYREGKKKTLPAPAMTVFPRPIPGDS